MEVWLQEGFYLKHLQGFPILLRPTLHGLQASGGWPLSASAACPLTLCSVFTFEIHHAGFSAPLPCLAPTKLPLQGVCLCCSLFLVFSFLPCTPLLKRLLTFLLMSAQSLFQGIFSLMYNLRVTWLSFSQHFSELQCYSYVILWTVTVFPLRWLPPLCLPFSLAPSIMPGTCNTLLKCLLNEWMKK